MVRAKGLPHVSRLVAHSIKDRAIIMEQLPGKNLAEIETEEAMPFTDAHLVDLIKTLGALGHRGLTIDANPHNFTYDQKEGFGVMDYSMHNGRRDLTMDHIFTTLRFVLTFRNYQAAQERCQGATNPERALTELAHTQQKNNVKMTVKLLQILKDSFPELFARRNEFRVEWMKMGTWTFEPSRYLPTNNPEIAKEYQELETLTKE